MKKYILILTFILTLLFNNSFATTNEYIEYSSGELDDGSIYLDSYEDYEDILQGVDEQEVYKEEYLKMMAETIKNYDEEGRDDTVKARVLSVENTEEYYSYDTYGIYKIKYQPINVQILEGKYKGQTFDVSYVLTADSYENIKVKEIKENTKINVVVYEYEGEEDPYVYATTIDSSIDRIGCTITLIIITIVLIGIYLGKKGLKLLPQIILLSDILLLIFAPELLAGRGIIWLTLITMILYLITNTALKVGLNSKTVAALVTTISVILITTIGLAIFNEFSVMSGIIYEMTTIIETFPKGTIDFNSLNISIYMLLATIVTSEIACKVLNTYKNEEKEESRLKIKEYVSEKILTVSTILLVLLMPKYLYMLIAKYNFAEIINSEMLTNEIARILFLIISMLLSAEVAIISKKFFVEDEEKK